MKISKNDFTKETIEKMKSTTKETKNVELGFVFCRKDDEKITYGKPTCTGESCSVDTGKSKCKSNEEDIGSFHSHPTNDIVSTEDLVTAHDQDVMCVGRKTLNPIPPFNNRVDCYTVINKKTKKYAVNVLKEQDEIENDTWNKVDNKQMSSEESHKILNNAHDKCVKKLLPLFHTFKIYINYEEK